MGDGRKIQHVAFTKDSLRTTVAKLEQAYKTAASFLCTFLVQAKAPLTAELLEKFLLFIKTQNQLTSLMLSCEQASKELKFMTDETSLLQAKYSTVYAFSRTLVGHAQANIFYVKAMLNAAALLGIESERGSKLKQLNTYDYKKFKQMGAKFEKDSEFQELIAEAMSCLLTELARPSPYPLVNEKNTEIYVAIQALIAALPENAQRLFLLGRFILYYVRNKNLDAYIKSFLLEYHTLHRDVSTHLSRLISSNSATPKQKIHFALAQMMAANVSLVALPNSKQQKKSDMETLREELNLVSKTRMAYVEPVTRLLSGLITGDPINDPVFFYNTLDVIDECFQLIPFLIKKLNDAAKFRENTPIVDGIDVDVLIENEILQQCFDQLMQFINANHLTLYLERRLPHLMDYAEYQESKKVKTAAEMKKMVSIEMEKQRAEAKQHAEFLLKLEEKEKAHAERIALAKKTPAAERQQQASEKEKSNAAPTKPTKRKKTKKQEAAAPNHYDVMFADAMVFISNRQRPDALKKYQEIITLAESENKPLMRLLALEGKLLIFCKLYQVKIRRLHQMLSEAISITTPVSQERLTKIHELFISCNELLGPISGINDVYRKAREDQSRGLDVEAKISIDISVDTINELRQQTQTKSEECTSMFSGIERRNTEGFDNFIYSLGMKNATSFQRPLTYQGIMAKGRTEYDRIPTKLAYSGKTPKKSNYTIEREAIAAMKKTVEQFGSDSSCLFDGVVQVTLPLTWLRVVRNILNGHVPNPGVLEALAKFPMVKKPADLSKERAFLREELQRDDAREYIKLLLEYDLLRKIFGIDVLENTDIETRVNIAIYKLQNVSGHMTFFTNKPQDKFSFLALEKAVLRDGVLRTPRSLDTFFVSRTFPGHKKLVQATEREARLEALLDLARK